MSTRIGFPDRGSWVAFLAELEVLGREATESCLRERGIDIELPSDEDVPGFGFAAEVFARTFGYGITTAKASAPSEASSTDSEMTAEISKCENEVASLASGPIINALMPIEEALSPMDGLVEERMVASGALEAWVLCMHDLGYNYENPFAIPLAFARRFNPDSPPPTDELKQLQDLEVATAVDDLSCQERTGFKDELDQTRMRVEAELIAAEDETVEEVTALVKQYQCVLRSVPEAAVTLDELRQAAAACGLAADTPEGPRSE